jgi:hypothetical protein
MRRAIALRTPGAGRALDNDDDRRYERALIEDARWRQLFGLLDNDAR